MATLTQKQTPGWCSTVMINVLSTDLQDGEREDGETIGEDSPVAHGDNTFDNQIHISVSGVCVLHWITVIPKDVKMPLLFNKN